MKRISVTVVRTTRDQCMNIASWKVIRPVHSRSYLHIELQARDQVEIGRITVDRLTRRLPGMMHAMGIVIVSVEWSGNCAAIVIGSNTTDLGDLPPARIAQVAECIFASAV